MLPISTDTPVKVFLKNYTQPAYWIRETRLHFDIYETYVDVHSHLLIEKNADINSATLILDGQDLELLSL